ncbi:putative mediator of RNA polymerase II transcription subunit 26 [Episyrphus balteatus]|uniref:putative mediator of RNA polymerase II transcription subunit 26 n=1 Tax=Episyrphus balteatus TaxID=286459 RepID=UPI00248573ED|nr:putative mediator of RNA polymerase II transcription subunit 26 [Episyrphus balteatus]
MPSASGSTNNKNQNNYSPPRKKTKSSKMVDARESLGEFESSIFDASDGHKLVDLIRRKKGLHVQTQKIFDDVPTQRPSLQIEFQRIDDENVTLQPEKLPQEQSVGPINPADIDDGTSTNGGAPSRGEFVPKSPRRTFVARSVTSPIIKMNSTTLGRRTLLKEFEKAFLHESRFLPEICSTPIAPDSNQQNHELKKLPKETTTSNSQKENIICSPITISDEDSPENRNINKSRNTENVMDSLIKQNELLKALVQESQDEPDATLVNKENTVNKSPRRTFTVECDHSTGKIILSPAKSSQCNNIPNTPPRKSQTFTRKLIATPEQRKLLISKFRLGIPKSSFTEQIQESPKKTQSRIPILSKTTTTTDNVVPCLVNQESAATAEFVERLQKNATPNCPVIVIPVNQTFNQAPAPQNNQTIPREIPALENPPSDEISSTISDNNPKAADYHSKYKEKVGKPARIDSPVSNVISSTTFSNGEAEEKGKNPEPPMTSLRWDDIITDDASSSDKSDCSRPSSVLSNKRRKLAKNKSQTKHSTVNNKKKLSLSYQCLDLRMHVDSDEESERNLPQKSRRLDSKNDEKRHEHSKHNTHQRSRRQASKNAEHFVEEREHNLHQRARRGASKNSEQCDEELENNLHQRPRRGTSKNAELCEEEREHNLHQRSRRGASKNSEQCDEERENNLHQRPQRGASKNAEFDEEEREHQRSRRGVSKNAEQCEEEREPNLHQRSRRGPSESSDQCNEERENNLHQRPRREASKNAELCEEEREHNLHQRSRRGASKTSEQCDERENNLHQRPRREASKNAELSEEEGEHQRSRRGASKNTDQYKEKDEHQLPQRSRNKVSNKGNQYEDNLPKRYNPKLTQCTEECVNDPPEQSEEDDYNRRKQSKESHSINALQRSRRVDSETSDQCDGEQEQISPLRSRREKYVEKQRNEKCANKLHHRSQREGSEIDEQRRATNIVNQCADKNEHRLRPSSKEQCSVDREDNIPQRSQPDSPKIQEQGERHPENNLYRKNLRETKVNKLNSENIGNNVRESARGEDFERIEYQNKDRENNLPAPSRPIISNTVEESGEESHLPRRSQHKCVESDKQTDKESENNLHLPRSSQDKNVESDKQPDTEDENNLQRPSRTETRNNVEQFDKVLEENHLFRQSRNKNAEIDEQRDKENEKNLEMPSRQQSSANNEQFDDQHKPRTSLRHENDISKVDKQLDRLRNTIQDDLSFQMEVFRPPDEFRDSSNSTSLEKDKDLVDEISSDRITLSQENFKRPSGIVPKKRRQKKKTPEIVQEYLQTDKRLSKTPYLNVSKRKLYSKGTSDMESDDSSFSKKETPEKLTHNHRKLSKSSESVSSRKNVASKTLNNSAQVHVDPSKVINKENLKKSNQKRASRPQRRSLTSCPSSSDEELSEGRVNKVESNKNLSVRTVRSTAGSANISKNSKQTEKRDTQVVHNISERNRSRSRLRSIESSTDAPDNEEYTKETSEVVSRKSHINIESNKEKNTSKRSPRKKSAARKSNVVDNIIQKNKSKNPQNDAESMMKEIHGEWSSSSSDRSRSRSIHKKSSTQTSKTVATNVVNNNQERALSLSPSKSDTYSTHSTICPSTKENAVEENFDKKTTKARSKKKIPKKTNAYWEEKTSTAPPITEDQDCGPRRSKREKKPPTAYWACPNSQYTHAYDIYTMLTAGKKPYFPEFLLNPKPKKKDKPKPSSTDDNLVVNNTNTIDSSSKKNKNKTKQQSKQKNKKPSETKTMENRESQLDSGNELPRANVSHEFPGSSTTEKQATTSVGKTKSKQTTKKKHNSSEEVALSSNSTSKDSHKVDNFKQPENYTHPSIESDLNSSDYPSEDDVSSVEKRRLTTIKENAETIFNKKSTTSRNDSENSNQRSTATLMPPPKTSVIKKVKKKSSNKNAFRTEHDESIADVSSVHVNNLFDQLKNSTLNNTMANRTRQEIITPNGQVSQDNGSSNTKRNTSNSSSNSTLSSKKNLSVRLKRLDFRNERPYDVNERNFDSGFSSEEMNSINPKKDILLDWLVQMLNKGRTPSNNRKGLAKLLQPNGCRTANADELKFEEIDGVEFAFYDSPGHKFGYLRFQPHTQKKMSCAKRHELNFILLGGTIQMTVDKETFDMKNGDLTSIFIGTSYRMRNITDDPALVMVIKN